jgi:hypothetical protein
MMTLNATPKEKLMLAVVVGILVLLIMFYFLLWSPYQLFHTARQENRQLEQKIEATYQEIVRLYSERQVYNTLNASISSARPYLTVENSRMLDVLTKNSPIKEFSYASLEKDKMRETQTGIEEYPFEIGFRSSYQQLGEYLIYQENSLPLSAIRSIEIKPVMENPGKLDTRITGIIYLITPL